MCYVNREIVYVHDLNMSDADSEKCLSAVDQDKYVYIGSLYLSLKPKFKTLV